MVLHKYCHIYILFRPEYLTLSCRPFAKTHMYMYDVYSQIKPTIRHIDKHNTAQSLKENLITLFYF